MVSRLPEPAIYQLKITLQDSGPPIWRRVQVRGEITLPKLHRIIQGAMGWSDSHLHEFKIAGVHYGKPYKEALYEIKEEKKVRLNQVISKINTKFQYFYDFEDEDDRVHKIVMEKILDPEPGVRYPTCVSGKRACPPEDCGGMGAYEFFVEAIRDPEHEDHEEMLEWIGGEFDPEAFDLETVNLSLKAIR